jgi:hypothetical protein
LTSCPPNRARRDARRALAGRRRPPAGRRPPRGGRAVIVRPASHRARCVDVIARRRLQGFPRGEREAAARGATPRRALGESEGRATSSGLAAATGRRGSSQWSRSPRRRAASFGGAGRWPLACRRSRRRAWHCCRDGARGMGRIAHRRGGRAGANTNGGEFPSCGRIRPRRRDDVGARGARKARRQRERAAVVRTPFGEWPVVTDGGRGRMAVVTDGGRGRIVNRNRSLKSGGRRARRPKRIGGRGRTGRRPRRSPGGPNASVVGAQTGAPPTGLAHCPAGDFGNPAGRPSARVSRRPCRCPRPAAAPGARRR